MGNSWGGEWGPVVLQGHAGGTQGHNCSFFKVEMFKREEGKESERSGSS